MQQVNGTQQRNGRSRYEPTPYEAAVLGFRNYWYPVFTSGEVNEKARAMTLLGDDLFLVRRQGKVYALVNECAHRGTRFTHPLGIYYFKGTPYHHLRLPRLDLRRDQRHVRRGTHGRTDEPGAGQGAPAHVPC